MQAFFFVLNRTEHLEHLLQEFAAQGIGCATVLDSKGMAHSLDGFTELHFTLSLRMILNPEHKESKTVFMVLKDEEIPLVSEIVNKVVGGLGQPDTGIMFAMPVTYLEGFTLK